MPDLIYIVFLFAFGACLGSFMNVVVWRLPQIMLQPHASAFAFVFAALRHLSDPPSTCPKCKKLIAWHDNIPILGWVFLRARCRNCQLPISARYPVVELTTGLLFAGTYVLLFQYHFGPCEPRRLSIVTDWPMLGLYLALVWTLLTCSLIDLDHFLIPAELCWGLAIVGVLCHGLIGLLPANPMPGGLALPPVLAAMSLGAGVGWILSLLLLRMGILKHSFAGGLPPLEFEAGPPGFPLTDPVAPDPAAIQSAATGPGDQPWTRGRYLTELRHEMLFLLPPMLLASVAGGLMLTQPAVLEMWKPYAAQPAVAGALGALWGAMVGAFVVWLVRILGSIGFGKEAMGMGDVHLMFGVGAVVGASVSTIAFFLAPFAGLLVAFPRLIFFRKHAIPYGPYLAIATLVTLLFYCEIAAWLRPGLQGLAWQFNQSVGGAGEGGF